jgi:hypothetical protein
VFARAFFQEEDRGNLPKAPACERCNGDKSRAEHYLTAVLPFGGRHAQAVETLNAGVPGRLTKNRKLHKELARTSEPAWLREDTGLYVPTGRFTFDSVQLEELLKYIGRGLAWHHWKAYLRPEDYVSVMFLTDMMTATFQQMIGGWTVARRVTNNLGRGAVQYESVQATDPAELTVWCVSMYGGVVLSSEARQPGSDAPSLCRWWVITGPREVGELIERLK